MKIKNKSYMKNSEFKKRQSCFKFFCAEAYEFIKQFKKDCRAGWKKLFSKPMKGSFALQLNLEFASPFSEHWSIWTPERNRILFS